MHNKTYKLLIMWEILHFYVIFPLFLCLFATNKLRLSVYRIHLRVTRNQRFRLSLSVLKSFSYPLNSTTGTVKINFYSPFIFILFQMFVKLFAICFHNFFVPVCTVLRDSFLCLIVYIHKSEAVTISVCPLKVVHEAPLEISVYLST